MKDEKEKEQAQKRAEVIMRVRTGQMTATDAAKALGVSRKTYYEWEKRGLGGMLDALENGQSGRPAEIQDPEIERFREELKDAKTRLLMSQRELEIRDLLEGARMVEAEEIEKIKAKKKRKKKK
jgi:transposase